MTPARITANRTAWTRVRRAEGLTRIDALADRLGVPRRGLGRVVEGRRAASPQLVTAASHAFPDVAFDELFRVRVV